MTNCTKNFMDLFCPRRDTFALKSWDCSKPPRKKYSRKEQPLSEEIVNKHLSVKDQGKFSQHIAIYPINNDGTCIFLCIDVDDHDGIYQEAVLPLTQTIARKLTGVGLSAHIEMSQGGHGYHVWSFFEVPVDANKLRAVIYDVLKQELVKQTGAPTLEVFPKQGGVNISFGSALALPYGCGSKSTFFAENDTDRPISLEQFVSSVSPLSPEILDMLIADRGISLVATKEYKSQPDLSHLPPEEIRFSRAQAYIASIPGAAVGDRSNSIYRVAALLQRDFALDQTQTYSLLQAWNVEHCSPPIDDDRLEKIIENADKYAKGEYGSKLYQLPGITTQQYQGVNLPGETVLQAQTMQQPTIVYRTGKGSITDMVQQSIDHLLAGETKLYSYGGILVEVIPEQEAPIKVVTEERLRELTDKSVQWASIDKTGKLKSIHPPKEIVKTVLANPTHRFPSLIAVTKVPILKISGEVIFKQGYNKDTGLYFIPLPGEKWEPIPEKITDEMLNTAVKKISELFVDFPFVKPWHRSACLAAVMTAIARHAIDGVCPLFLFNGNAPGVGKGILCNIVSILAAGKNAEVTQYDKDKAELRKKFTSFAIAGESLVLLDNIEEKLGGGVLDSLLTSERLTDRILGKSQSFSGKWKVTWLANGNNIQIKGDSARRIIPVELKTELSNPELRSDFVIKNIEQYVADNRTELVTAVLTLLKGYIGEGFPEKENTTSFGSFYKWSDLIRGTLVWLEMDDPLVGQQDFRKNNDMNLQSLESVLLCWYERYGDQPQSIASVYATHYRKNDGNTVPPENSDVPLMEALCELAPFRNTEWNKAGLSYTFRRYKDRIVNGLKLTSIPGANKTSLWAVTKIEPED